MSIPITPTSELGLAESGLAESGAFFYFLSSDSIDVSAPIVSEPVFSEIHNFEGIPISTGAPAIVVPVFSQLHAIGGEFISTGAPSIDEPIADQIFNFVAVDVVTGNVILSTASINQSNVLPADPLTTGNIEVQEGDFSQKHILFTQSILSGFPSNEMPIIGQIHGLSAPEVVTARPTIGLASLSQPIPTVDVISPNIIITVINRLIPPVFGPRMRALLDALGGEIDGAYSYLSQTNKEANPGTADDTLADWYAQLGIPYDSTQTLGTLQRQARQAWTARGGQATDPLNDQIQVAFPDVFVQRIDLEFDSMVGVVETGDAQTTSYPAWYGGAETGEQPVNYYYVYGDVESQQDFNRLVYLLERIGPAEMEPVYSVFIAGETAASETGIAVTNLAECGTALADIA